MEEKKYTESDLRDAFYNEGKLGFESLTKHVIVEFAPISDRMWYKGEEGVIINNQIRLGGNWFNFDERYIVKDI